MLRYTFLIVVMESWQTQPEICESNEFLCHNDIDATEIALKIFESCDDVASDYWLWAPGNRLVATNLRKQGHFPLKDLPAIVRRRQENVVAVEEALKAGHDCLSRSRRLLKAQNSLRAAIEKR